MGRRVPSYRLFALVLLLALLMTSLPPQQATILKAAPPPPTSSTASTPIPSRVPPADYVPAPLHTGTQPPPAQPSSAPPTPARPLFPPTQIDFSTHPLSFMATQGKRPVEIQFEAHDPSGSIFVTPDRLVVAVPTAPVTSSQRLSTTAGIALQLHYLGANGRAVVTGTHRLPGTMNLYLGTDASHWIRNGATYGGIVTQQLYPGIDVHFEGTPGKLKSTYVVAPGADPTRIKWRYEYAKQAQVDPATGNLHIHMPATVNTTTLDSSGDGPELVEQQPVAWQDLGGKRVPVSVQYTVAPDGSLSFTLGSYDQTQPLTIDPTLLYNAVPCCVPPNGAQPGYADAVAVDSAGNIYATGGFGYADTSIYGGYPANWRFYNVVTTNNFAVYKMGPDGTVIYATIINANQYGCCNQSGITIAVDAAGNAYAVDAVGGSGNPVLNAAQATYGGGLDAYWVKLDPLGQLLVASYLGGAGDEIPTGIALDGQGSVYLSGSTTGSLPTTTGSLQASYGGGSKDGFIAKYTTAGALVFSTYLGGSGQDVIGNDAGAPVAGNSVAADSSGVYVTGSTASTDFITTTGAFQTSYRGGTDAFVTKVAPDGTSALYSTYLGGSGSGMFREDVGNAIAVDSGGNAYIAGQTGSSDFPVTAQAFQHTFAGYFNDGFVTKLNATGSATVFSTFLGGYDEAARDRVTAIGVDAQGIVYVIGVTAAANFPLVNPFYPTYTGGGNGEGYATQIAADGASLSFSTFVPDGGWMPSLAVTPQGGFVIATRAQTIITIGPPPVLPADQARAACSCENAGTQAPAPGLGLAPQPSTGGPFNTRTGSYWTEATDLVLSSPGPQLAWTRTYANQAISDTTGFLGLGWQYPAATRLITPTMPGGEPNTVIILSAGGNRLRFREVGDVQLQPWPGIYSTLRRDAAGTTYTETLPNLSTVIFDATGRAVKLQDPQGRTVTIGYDPTAPAQVVSLTDSSNPGRYLTLSYTTTGAGPRISQVSDPGGRTVQYGYDATTGDLTSVTDVMGRTTHYTYLNHVLTAIVNPLGQTVEQQAYDSYTVAGRVISQTLQDGRVIQAQYLTATTIITTTNQGQTDVQQFAYDASSNTLTGQTSNSTTVQQTGFNLQLRPGTFTDGNGNRTTLSWTPRGLPLTVTNALSQSVQVQYDAQNRPSVLTNTMGRITTYAYDSNNNVVRQTTGITTAFPLGFTTLYTYNAAKDLIEQRAPDGVVTHYDRDPQGRVVTMTVSGAGTAGQSSSFDPNLLLNPGFESNLDQWSHDSGTAPVLDSTWKRSGQYAARLPGNGCNCGTTDLWQRLPIQTAGEYRLSLYYKGTYDLLIDGQSLVGTTYPTSDGTTQQVYTVTFTAGTHKIDLWNRGTDGWVDDVALSSVNPITEPIPDLSGDGYNLLTNPSFETGDTSSWASNSGYKPVVSTLWKTDGAYSVWLPGNGCDCGQTNINQTVNVVTAGQYHLSFVYRGTYDILIDGNSLFAPPYPVDDGTHRRVYTMTLSTGSHKLDIWSRGIDAYLDDVRLALVGSPSSTTPPAAPAQPAVTTYGYDSLGRVVTTTVGAGTTLQRVDITRYNADNTIAQTIQKYQDGLFDPTRPDEDISTTYGYDAVGRRMWVKDALGHYDLTHYDAQGQVDWTLRNWAPVSLDAQGQPVLPTTAPSYSASQPDANVATLYGYDGLGRTVLVTQTGILTGSFNTTSKTFSATTTRVTKTEYDTLNRPITVTQNYQANQPIYSANPPAGSPDVNVQTITRYDTAGNITGQRDGLGRWAYTQYDALNRPVTITVNYENGSPLTIDAANQSWATLADTDIIQVIRYTADGQVERQVENYGDGVFSQSDPTTDRVTLFQYDALGRVITTTQNYAPGLSGPDLNRTQVTAYDGVGRVLGQQDPLGRWNHPEYDLLGRVVATVQNCRDATGTPVAQGCGSSTAEQNIRTSTAYDGLGQAFETVNPLGSVTHQTYDGLGRMLATTQNYTTTGPSNAFTNVTTWQGYDALGHTTVLTDALGAVTYQSVNALGQTIIVTDTMGRVTQMGYDGTGLQRWTLRPDGHVQVTLVDGLGRPLTTIANYQDGSVGAGEPADQDLMTRFVYDGAGRRVQLIDAAGRITVYGYDLRDQLVSVQENVQTPCTLAPCGVLTQYQYDRLGNRIAIIDANNHTRRFGYNAAGERISATDALSRTTGWQYDAGGRITTQNDPRGSSYDLSYSYDGLDRLIQLQSPNLAAPIQAQYDALGQRTVLTDSSGITSFSYDALGRITQVMAPQTGSVGYGYNALGLRTQLTYPDSTSLSYAYWNDGQLKTVVQANTTLASYSYDGQGRLQQVTRTNGASTGYGYDGVDRLQALSTTVGSTLLSSFQYQVDRLGQRTLVTETIGTPSLTTRSLSYRYDGLLRLTGVQEQPGSVYTYTYDLVGNRLSAATDATSSSWSYDAADQVSTAGWSYDAAGNLLSDGSSSYSYDALNRLLSASQGTISQTYAYNGDGTLVTQTTGSTTTRYSQDLALPLSQILQGQGSVTTTYLYGTERLASISGTARAWFAADGLGSVRQILSDAGTVTTAQRYDAWGTPLDGTTPTTFGFTGEYQEASLGLVYLRARWYTTATGRFLTRDPFEGVPLDPMSLAPYLYVGDRPSNQVDPSGQCYGPFAGLRNISIENDLCHNADLALTIVTHPNATWDQKTEAGLYLGAMALSHAGLMVSGGMLAVAAAPAVGGAAVAGGTTVAAAMPELVTTAGAVGEAANVAADAYLMYQAANGDMEAANYLYIAQQMGYVPFSSALEAGLFGWSKLSRIRMSLPKLGSLYQPGLTFAPEGVSLGGFCPATGLTEGEDLFSQIMALTRRGGSARILGRYSNVNPDAHHIIQTAAAKDLPGYSHGRAPAIRLQGPSTIRATEHGLTRPAQMYPPRWLLFGEATPTYASERRVAYYVLRRAGLTPSEAREAVEFADTYFLGELGITLDTPMRTPGDRRYR